MKISEANEFSNAGTLTVPSDDDTTQTKANMESADFSEAYTSLGSSGTFSIQKTWAGGARFTCEYIAIAGHNFGTDGGSVEVFVKGVSKGSQSFADDNRNSVVMFAFTAVTLVDDIDIIYTKGTSTNRITISFIAAGTVLEVPNDGEQAGYARPWLNRNSKQRVQENDEAAPVLIAVQQFSPTLTLTVPAMGRSFAEATWRNFLDFIATTPFFIRERDDNNRSAYLCFDAQLMTATPKAHSQTRELVSVSIRFQAFTGT